LRWRGIGIAIRGLVLPHPYAFNLFSHNSKIDPATGYTEEETKVLWETHKIFGDESAVPLPTGQSHRGGRDVRCSERM